jgi:hypothetical protein
MSNEPQPIKVVGMVLLPIKSKTLSWVVEVLKEQHGKDLQMRTLLNRVEFFIERKEGSNDKV